MVVPIHGTPEIVVINSNNELMEELEFELHRIDHAVEGADSSAFNSSLIWVRSLRMSLTRTTIHRGVISLV